MFADSGVSSDWRSRDILAAVNLLVFLLEGVFLLSLRNAASGTTNCTAPQSKQSASSSCDTRTWGLSKFFSPITWKAISALNLPRFSELHDLQTMAATMF